MLEKMDTLVAQVNATLPLPRNPTASSEPRRMTKDEARQIMRDAYREQEGIAIGFYCPEPGTYHKDGQPRRLDEIVTAMMEKEKRFIADDVAQLIAMAGREQEVLDTKRRETRLQAFIESVGKRSAQASLESYIATSPEQKKTVQAIRNYLGKIKEHIDAGNGVVMFGGVGSGKTHLLVGMGKDALAADCTVAWANGSDLYARFRAAISGGESENEIVSELVATDILILDDILPPGGTITDYQSSVLYRIVNLRYQSCRPTWASLNVAGGAEAEHGMGMQIVDRLRDGALCLFFDWESYRKAQS